MSSNKKEKNNLKNIIGDFSGLKWKDLDHKKVYGAIAILVAIIVVIVVLIAKPSAKSSADVSEDAQNPAAVEAVAEEVVDETPLEVDAYEEMNDLVFRYFYGRCMGDIEMLEETVDVLTEEEIKTVERKKDYIEAYKSIQCYTKKGLEEGSYVVFASYEMKIYDIETLAPGIEALYVCTADDGSYYIYNGEASEELTNYVLELAAGEDVSAVIADVDARYRELVAENEDLGTFAQTVLEAQQEQPEEAVVEEPVDENTSNKELEEPIVTKVNDGIRIRSERSTDSRIIAVIVTGTEVKVYANYEDGWSKIEYSGTVGYCKTEFLESTEGVPTVTEADTEEAEEETAETEETTQTTTTEATAVNKKMKLTDAIRIRADRSTDSEIKTRGYKNEIVTVLETYSDGWCKVDYNGTVGYCMSQYLAEAN